MSLGNVEAIRKSQNILGYRVACDALSEAVDHTSENANNGAAPTLALHYSY